VKKQTPTELIVIEGIAYKSVYKQSKHVCI